MFSALLHPFLLSALGASILAQAIKTCLDFWMDRPCNWKTFFRGAGMPSSHTATVVGLTTAVWFQEGFSHLFYVALVFATIVMRDVMGDKIFAAQQEQIINDFIDEISHNKPIQWNHLIGHTGLEVVAGFLVGLSVAYTVNIFF